MIACLPCYRYDSARAILVCPGVITALVYVITHLEKLPERVVLSQNILSL